MSSARTTRDHRFSFESAGDPGRPALVFLHGIGGAARAFRAQLDHFSDRYYAVAWDMPGYGGSAMPDQFTIAGLATALGDFLRSTDIARPVLVGHSIGGMIVQQALADEPAIASAVVLTQTSPAFGKPDGDWQRAFIAARLGPLDRGETLASLAPSLVAELAGDDPDADGMALARSCMAAVPEGSYRAAMLALMGFDLRAHLPRIAVPTLVLSGSKDTNAPSPMMARMAAQIPGAVYTDLTGAGHLANLERPAAFDAALDDFLKSPAVTEATS